MSAPIVSGIAALVKSKFLSCSPTQLVHQIKETGVSWDFPHPSRRDSRNDPIRIKATRIDALSALTPVPVTGCQIAANPAQN